MRSFNAVTKNNSPNRPYIIEGIPDKVSAVILTSLTSLLFFRAYSVRYTAANIPNGAANNRARNVISNVLIRAGKSDTFSVVYFHSNSFGDIFGMPLKSI